MCFKKSIDGRIKNFLGYGKLDSDIWLIGMEEGLGGDDNDLKNRFKNTEKKQVIDIQKDMNNVKDHMQYFKGNKRQRTWSKLILILLTLKSDNGDNEINRDDILNYQQKRLGRNDKESDHCLLELMPLPCKSIHKNNWFYNESKIDYLKNRGAYMKKIAPIQIKRYQELIEKHKPKIVIFYSFSKEYIKYWEEIIRAKCSLDKECKFILYAENDRINYFIIPHPIATSLKNKPSLNNKKWKKIARRIKGLSNY